MINIRPVSTALLVFSAIVGTIAAQDHDTFACVSLGEDSSVGSSKIALNGLFRFGTDGFWVPVGVNDPYSTAIAVDPRDSNVIYTATLRLASFWTANNHTKAFHSHSMASSVNEVNITLG